MSTLPLFPTTIAGSLPKPAWLAEPEKLWPKWQAEGAALTSAKEDAALLWLKTQEDAGIDIVTDGEQFRIHFVHGFMEHLSGIDWAKKTQMGIRNNRYVVDVPTVTGPIARKRSVHKDEVRFTRAHTKHALKFTLGHVFGVADNASLGTAEGNIHDSALPSHPARQGANFVQRDIRCVSNTTFCRAS